MSTCYNCGKLEKDLKAMTARALKAEKERDELKLFAKNAVRALDMVEPYFDTIDHFFENFGQHFETFCNGFNTPLIQSLMQQQEEKEEEINDGEGGDEKEEGELETSLEEVN